MTRPQLVTLGSLWLLAGCGPSVLPQAEVDRVCGQESPVELLELDAGTRVQMQGLLSVSGVERLVMTTMPGDSLDEQALSQSVVWSVGPCGENPVQIGDGWWIRTIDAWPDVVLACGNPGDTYVLDPTGRRAPSLLFEAVACNPWWTALGVVTNSMDDQVGPVVLLPLPDDPWTGPAEPIVLIERARLEHETTGWRSSRGDPQVVDDELFAVTEDHVLVRIDLEERTSVEVATDVHAFDASAEFIVWQARSDRTNEEGGPVGPIYALDRTTEEVTELMFGMLDATPFPTNWAAAGVVVLRTDPLEGEELMFFVPSSDPIVVPEGRMLRQRVDERWIIQGWGGPYALWDPQTGEQTPFLDAKGFVWQQTTDTWLAWLGTVDAADANHPDEAELLRLEPDREPVTLAPRASRFPYVLDDDRVITRVDTEADGRSNLIVVEPDTHHESLIDDQVLDSSAYPEAWPHDVFYARAEDDRVRLLRTRLPAESG